MGFALLILFAFLTCSFTYYLSHYLHFSSIKALFIAPLLFTFASYFMHFLLGMTGGALDYIGVLFGWLVNTISAAATLMLLALIRTKD